jgi:hypothetical protein
MNMPTSPGLIIDSSSDSLIEALLLALDEAHAHIQRLENHNMLLTHGVGLTPAGAVVTWSYLENPSERL